MHSVLMHDRSRMTIDRRSPTLPDGGRRAFGNQTDIAGTRREGPGGGGGAGGFESNALLPDTGGSSSRGQPSGWR